jgi:hypothetical protein
MAPARAINLAALAAMATIAALSQPAAAQQGISPPHIAYVYPAGGQQATTLEVRVGGQYFGGVSGIYISGAGVKAKLVEHIRPIQPGKATELRDKLAELMKEPQQTEALIQTIAEIRAALYVYQMRPPPAVADVARLEVTIDAAAVPGHRELRLRTPQGLSNPVVFCVGQLPETSVRAAGAVTAEDFKNPRTAPKQQPVAPPRDLNITLPVVANGQIMPGGVDRYHFAAKKGQRLVATAAARELIPYLADAVPGWFQAALTVYDAKGRELAHADHTAFRPDPTIVFDVPADGEYVLAIRDSIYRGRQDFVYRLTVGELPPPALTFPLRDFDYLDLGESAASGANTSAKAAQAVKLPLAINGRIDKPGVQHCYSFDGKAGEEVVAEVRARRLGSSLDSMLRLVDSAGKELAASDDCDDAGMGLLTHHADSYIRTRLPADGTYCVQVADAQRQYGPECSYRLRIGPPRRDFELRVTPSALNLRPGLSGVLTVYALRKDGFAGEIELSLKDAPAGFALAGGRVPAGVEQVRVTVSAPATATPEPVALVLQGKAAIDGRQVLHQAVAAEDMMQAFAYRHLVPAEALYAMVSGKGSPRGVNWAAGQLPVRLAPGGTTRLKIAFPSSGPSGTFAAELDSPPPGISIARTTPGPLSIELELKAEPDMKPTQGNLIFSVYVTPKPTTSASTRPAGTPQRVLIGTLPAAPFEVAPAAAKPAGGKVAAKPAK